MTFPRKQLPIFLLVLVVVVVQFVTMPRFYYPGDNIAPYNEAAYLLSTGELGIPCELGSDIGVQYVAKGQYYFENDVRDVYSSKYGIGNTAAYILPLLAEKALHGKIARTQSQLFIITIWQIFLSVVIALYLYLLLGLYSSKKWLNIGVVLASFYTTYAWYYLRSPALEIYQIVSYVAMAYHTIRFMQLRELNEVQTKRVWLHLLGAIFFSCYLVLLKLSFAVTSIVLTALVATAGVKELSLLQRVKENWKTYRNKYALYFILPATFFVALLLLSNTHRFGNPLTTGYGQWVENGKSFDHFSISYLKDSLLGYFVLPGNANIFLHYPLLLFSLLGVPLFIRKFSATVKVITAFALSNLALLVFFSSWRGEWCYGPRYLVYVCLLFTLPLMSTLEYIWTKKAWHKISFFGVMAVLLLWSLVMQIRVISLPYFTHHYLAMEYKTFQVPEITEYFESYWHFGQLNKDLIEHKKQRKIFPPQQTVLDKGNPEEGKEFILRLEELIRARSQWNYYWFHEE